MSWQDQGRQEHGWFGNGTAPQRAKNIRDDDGLFARDGLARRIAAVAHGATAALPRALRGRTAAQYDAAGLERLTDLMTAWSRGATLGQARFAELFFGRSADDPVAVKLRSAALGAATARSHATLRAAAENLADAMQSIGIDRWRRFLAEAQDRARDPATVAAARISASLADPRRDAIRPVYPIETLLGIGVAGVMGGAGAALRRASGAVLRQVVPEQIPVAPEEKTTPEEGKAAPTNRSEKPEIPSIPLKRATFGHTFDRHGQDATEFLRNRSKITGQPSGQFLDDQAAARFILDNLDKAKGGPVSVLFRKDFRLALSTQTAAFRRLER